jgi:transcription-repair coupling factor (superfamily II helicase)
MPASAPVGVVAVQLLAAARESGPAGLVHLTTSERRAEQIARFLAAAAPDLEVAVFPPWDCLPYDRASPSREAMGRRMAVLRTLSDRRPGGTGKPKGKSKSKPPTSPLLVLTTPEAALQRVLPAAAIRSLELRAGEPLEAEALRRFCREAGYVEDERVDEVGEAAFRGEVIDLFPAGHRTPVRLEVLDGRLAALRAYDPLTQRTIEDVVLLRLDPASELPGTEDGRAEPGSEHWLPEAYAGLETLFDHLPNAPWVQDPRAGARLPGLSAQIVEAHRDRTRTDAAQPADAGVRPALPPARLYLTEAEWRTRLAGRELELSEAEDRFKRSPGFATRPRPDRAFAEFLRGEANAGRRVLLTAAVRSDLAALTRRTSRVLEQPVQPVRSWDEAAAAEPGAVLALEADLDDGFLDKAAGLAVVTARDLLGSRAKRADEGPVAVAPWRLDAADLRLGDVVVHVDHGVGVLRGLEPVETPAGSGEAMRLVYARDDVLLTPAEEADKLWRYGSEEGAVSLDRLNTDGWLKRRAKIHTELEETARELIALAAEREGRRAPALVPPAGAYERFVSRFPYPETPDQRRAIEEVLADLAADRPMDRLVVGDVGFGKTEVALRAAGAASLAGKQVAVVAPTTVLARQHFNTFARRFADLGVEVAHLSRLVPPEEARRVKAGLADGSVRVVVGTHALAGEGVEFADLGLLIVDEEQRFGTGHKARLRSLGEGVHALTLTATPIPRTLQTALVGLQDLSTILTPPSRRRPIRTFNAVFDPATIRTALLREQRRGGQSFVVVPRIEDIEPTRAQIRALAPELDLRVAHGKMPARDVDVTMVEFAEGRGDVLLATSIIESGLDVPRANTMVVLRADLFGLAQLHQLRGRVGRGRAQGVCYLMTGAGGELSEATAKRLGTLQAFDRLGAGMAISARDLDLRGAGDLMGDEQAGHVRLIGLSLYQELLAAALKHARGEPADDWTTEFQIDAGRTIPADYVPEPEIRMNLYHRAARAAAPAEVEALAEEIADRFGPPPPPVRNLLSLSHARTLARALRVVRIAAGPQAIALSFEPGVDPERTFADAFKRLNGALAWTGERMLYRRPSETPEDRSALVLELLEALA